MTTRKPLKLRKYYWVWMNKKTGKAHNYENGPYTYPRPPKSGVDVWGFEPNEWEARKVTIKEAGE